MLNFNLERNIINSLIINIKFYLNIKYKLMYNLNIFIKKFNCNYNIILYYMKNINNKIMFNLRNKLNFNKSKHNLMSNKKKTGKARLGSKSSNTLRKGLTWYGLRNETLKKYKYNKNLLNYFIVFKHNIFSINNLEVIKFIHNISLKKLNIYKNINKNCKNFILNNFLKNYYKISTLKNNINIIY